MPTDLRLRATRTLVRFSLGYFRKVMTNHFSFPVNADAGISEIEFDKICCAAVPYNIPTPLASHTAALEAHFRACAPLDAGRSGFAGVVSGARPVVERAELPATEELPTVDEPEEGRPRALRMAPS